ncbi:hypothetical protein DPMN_034788 [Dreissena polymorpha]|uniref:Uncharacterized protein n=1 Tax=Dreissena polymorpha TaxID=45954 RepID=A0A9D4M7G9_DREPO|nr:hypothetical protein DPMN_034788 [Dreissena polymorpha]
MVIHVYVATVEQFCTLPGVDESLAVQLIKLRNRHGSLNMLLMSQVLGFWTENLMGHVDFNSEEELSTVRRTPLERLGLSEDMSMKSVATSQRSSNKTGGIPVSFMAQLDEMDCRYKAMEEQINLKISRVSARLHAVPEVKPKLHVEQSSSDQTINQNVSNHKDLVFTSLTGHCQDPIVQLKFNDEANYKKMEWHAHRKMLSPIRPSQNVIDYHENTYQQRDHMEMKPSIFNQGQRGMDYHDRVNNLPHQQEQQKRVHAMHQEERGMYMYYPDETRYQQHQEIVPGEPTYQSTQRQERRRLGAAYTVDTDHARDHSRSRAYDYSPKRGMPRHQPNNLRYDGCTNWLSFKQKFESYCAVNRWSDSECRDYLNWCLEGKALWTTSP